MALKPVLVTPPAADPVTLTEAKKQVEAVDHTDDDELLLRLIKAATRYVELQYGRLLINQMWRIDLPAFPSNVVIGIPLQPISSIASIIYWDDNNTQQTLASSVYALLEDHLGPYVDLQVGQEWPATYERADAVSINVVAGYGAAATDVPDDIRHAVLLLVGHWYANREATSEDAMPELPLGMKALLHTIWRPYV